MRGFGRMEGLDLGDTVLGILLCSLVATVFLGCVLACKLIILNL